MDIIPKEGDEKEHVGLIPLLFVNYLLGLGICYIGQRTKNPKEFFGGIVFFAVMIAGILSGPNAMWVLGLLSLGSWAYIAVRLVWIAVKKEAGIKLF